MKFDAAPKPTPADTGGPSAEYQDPLFDYWEIMWGGKIIARSCIPTWVQRLTRRGVGRMSGAAMMEVQRRFTRICMSIEKSIERGDNGTEQANRGQAMDYFNSEWEKYPKDGRIMKCAYSAAVANARAILSGEMDDTVSKGDDVCEK